MNKFKTLTFDMILYDDESVKEKLTVLDKMEIMFDDGRNSVPDEYYDMIENIPLGSTLRITVEILK